MNDIILVSGGFDPIHSGHINLIKDASKYGDVVVLLNSDNWLNGWFHKNSAGLRPARWQAIKVSRSVLEPGNWITAILLNDDIFIAAYNRSK